MSLLLRDERRGRILTDCAAPVSSTKPPRTGYENASTETPPFSQIASGGADVDFLSTDMPHVESLAGTNGDGSDGAFYLDLVCLDAATGTRRERMHFERWTSEAKSTKRPAMPWRRISSSSTAA
jgi:hypothetical protein